MARGLRDQNISIGFSKAIDSDTADEARQLNDLQIAENGFYNQGNMFESCLGFSKLDNNTSNNFKSIFNYKGSFVSTTDRYLYAYSSTDKFFQVGDISTLTVKSEGIYRSPALTATNQDSSINPVYKIACITWFETGRGIIYSIYDTTTKSYVVPPTILDANGTQAKSASVVGNKFIIGVARSGTTTIVTYSYDLTNRTLSSAVTMQSNIRAANMTFDLIPYIGNNGITIGYANTSNDLAIFHVTPDNVKGTSSNGYYNETTDTSVDIQKALSINRIDTDILVAYNELSSVNIKSRWYGSDFVPLTSIQTIGTLTSSTTANAITSIRTDTSTAAIFVDEINATYRYGKLFAGSVTRSGTVSLTQRATGLMIAGKAFLNTAGVASVITIHKSTEQSQYVVIDTNGKINANYSTGVAGDNSTTAQLDNVTNTTLVDDTIYSVLLNKGRLSSVNGSFYTISGLILNTLLKDDTNKTSAEYCDSLYLSGGTVKVYDGTITHEAGFLLYPEGLAQQATATTGGFISNGTYAYKAVFEYYDANGRLHESKTSTQVQYTAAGGTSTQTITIRVPTVCVSEKANVIVSLYRTTAGGTIFYKVTSLTAPTTINPISSTFTDITDTLADTTIISNQQLYTTGGILDNAAFPSCSTIKSINGRLWFGGCENRRLAYYSKLSNQFQATQMASEFFYDTLEGGDIVALGEFGNNALVFKESGTFVITGTPALNNKQGSTLQPIRKLAINTTTINNQCIYEASEGVYFMSSYGLQMLSYNGELVNVGEPVSNKLIPSDVTCIRYVEDLKHIRVFTNNNCWVRDQTNNQWYNWTNHGARSAVTIAGKSVFVKTDGYVRQEDSSYSADSAPITLKVKTGWITVPSPLNVERIYTMWPVLKYFTDHTIRFNLYYDFESAVTETFDVNSSTITGSSDVYGSGSTYGGQTIYGGDIGYNNVYQPEIQPSRQECEAFAVEIIIYNNGNTIGKGCGLIGLVLNVGVSSTELQRKQSKRISAS